MSAMIITGYDPETLQETVNVAEAEARLAEIESLRSLEAVTEKTSLYRVLGRIDEAWDAANEAVRTSRFAGDREKLLRARIRRAVVQQARGRLSEAVNELTGCATEAASHEWPITQAFALQHRGKVQFAMFDFAAALRDFEQALQLRTANEAPEDQIESSRFAANAAERRLRGGAARGGTTGLFADGPSDGTARHPEASSAAVHPSAAGAHETLASGDEDASGTAHDERHSPARVISIDAARSARRHNQERDTAERERATATRETDPDDEPSDDDPSPWSPSPLF